jgi:hypothetical protein
MGSILYFLGTVDESLEHFEVVVLAAMLKELFAGKNRHQGLKPTRGVGLPTDVVGPPNSPKRKWLLYFQ